MYDTLLQTSRANARHNVSHNFLIFARPNRKVFRNCDHNLKLGRATARHRLKYLSLGEMITDYILLCKKDQQSSASRWI